MYILIEGYQYEAAAVKDVLHGMDALENVDGKITVNYVGYFYNTLLKDCVFILPKVLLNEEEKVFGEYQPEIIINLNTNGDKILKDEEREFIYEFAVWIYRAIVVFKNNNDTDIIYQKKVTQSGQGHRQKSDTFLDIILALIQFNKENQNFFFFILRNLHSGYNKINWTRTISTSSAIVQNDNPIYLNPVNKKRQINFDEELLIIYFSILNYLFEYYGFSIQINCNFELIKGKQFETYINGLGKTRLLQIKYKYFSDKALMLWDLCYAFFDHAKQVRINNKQQEYLLAKNFNIIFEAIIDDLIGDKDLPDGMNKKMEDGKIIDHLYRGKSLIENAHTKDKYTYYIGDSKYYKIGHELGPESIYKQYTYAKNVIQWNIDIFNSGSLPSSGIKLRDDELTEGYNIIPNFFISAKLEKKEGSDKPFDYYDDGINKTDRAHNKHKQVHFKNRLFDRDTLLLFYYDVNFLFVLSLYARNNTLQKSVWKGKIREIFRKDIQDWLQDDYDFYVMAAHPDVNAGDYIKEHFQEVLGKIYTPYSNKGIYSLALDKNFDEDNKLILEELQKYFYVRLCRLGDNPEEIIEKSRAAEKPMPAALSLKNGVLMIMMENFPEKSLKFLSDGKLAVGVKLKKSGIEIIENIHSIGYVLFHTWNDSNMHLFAVNGECITSLPNELDASIYKNVTTADIYIIAEISTSAELDTMGLSLKNNKTTSQERYDAKFSTINELRA